MSTQTMSMIMLKRSYQIVSSGKGRKDTAELRDTARNGLVIATGTYKQVYAEAKRRGLTYA